MKKFLLFLGVTTSLFATLAITNRKSVDKIQEQIESCNIDTTQSLNTILTSIEWLKEERKIMDTRNEALAKIAEIESIKDREEYFVKYKNIVSEYEEYLDPPETIYDYYTDAEMDLLFRVVQAEIGNYSFNQKCNVVSVIFNRINSNKFPNAMSEVLVPSQFSTISNGSIHRVTVDESTILACEYVFMFGDTTGEALFFDSNGALNYKFLFNDGAHNFYTTYN